MHVSVYMGVCVSVDIRLWHGYTHACVYIYIRTSINLFPCRILYFLGMATQTRAKMKRLEAGRVSLKGCAYLSNQVSCCMRAR